MQNSALAMELRLFCIKSSMLTYHEPMVVGVFCTYTRIMRTVRALRCFVEDKNALSLKKKTAFLGSLGSHWDNYTIIHYYTWADEKTLNDMGKSMIGTEKLLKQSKAQHNRIRISRNVALQWRHKGRDSVWNHQPHGCLLNRLFRRRSKKLAPRHWPLCGEFTGDLWIPRTNGQ